MTFLEPDPEITEPEERARASIRGLAILSLPSSTGVNNPVNNSRSLSGRRLLLLDAVDRPAELRGIQIGDGPTTMTGPASASMTAVCSASAARRKPFGSGPESPITSTMLRP